MAKRSGKKAEERLSVALGNLHPRESATLKLTIVSELEVQEGYYAFTLPVAFYPDYERHGMGYNDERFIYNFKFEA